jgi:maleylpyruvate isomerase
VRREVGDGVEGRHTCGRSRTDVRHDSGVVQGRSDRLDGLMDTSATLPQLDETLLATTRYLQALTLLDEESVRRPSLLSGWSRAHVVGHLSRNADAFARVLTQAASGERGSMYDAQSTRERDIEDTARKDLGWLVEDANRSAQRLEHAWRRCGADPDTPYSRLPDGQETFPLHTVGFRRRAEVEIHHADLDLGYLPSTWPTDFSLRMVAQRQEELARLPEGGPAMVLSSTDVEGLWRFGSGPGPEVRGSVGDLAWWLVGRGGGAGLECPSGRLPVLGPWR